MCNDNGQQLEALLIELIANGNPATVEDNDQNGITLNTWQEVNSLRGLLNENGMDGFDVYVDLVNSL